jgi:hypothetical protein
VSESVQGFANRETWAVALQLDNDRRAHEQRRSRYPEGATLTPLQAEAFVREWVTFSERPYPDGGFDALSADDLAAVSWECLAVHWSSP